MGFLSVGLLALLGFAQPPSGECQPPHETVSALRPVLADWSAQWNIDGITKLMNVPTELIVGTKDTPTLVLVNRVGSASQWSCGQMLHINGGRLMDVRIRFASKMKGEVLAALEAYMTLVPEPWRATVMTVGLRKRVLSGRRMFAPFSRHQPLDRGAISERLEISLGPDKQLGTAIEFTYIHVEGHL